MRPASRGNTALTLARNEAVRRNAQVEFVTDADGWEVRIVATATVLHQGSGKRGRRRPRVTITPDDADRVTFDSFGRVVDPNPDGSEPIPQVDIASANPPASTATSRCASRCWPAA